MGQYLYGDTKASVIAINATFCSINSVILAVRYFTRWRLVKQIGADDILTVFAAVFIYAGSITTCILTRHGLGVHLKDVSPTDLVIFLKIDFFVIMAYEMSLMFVKLSLLAFYLRIAPFYHRKFRWSVFFMMVIVSLLGIASITMNLVSCKPVSYIWNQRQPGHCMRLSKWIWAQASLNFITDIIVYIFPFTFLWRLQITKRHKLGLCALFGLGGIAVIASIIRLSTIKHFQNLRTDFTWDIVLPLNWSQVEVHLALFVGCAPSVTAFLRVYHPAWLGTIVSRATGQGSSKSNTVATDRTRTNGDVEMNHDITSPDVDTDHDEAEITRSAYFNADTKGGDSHTKRSSVSSFHTATKPVPSL